MNCIYAEYILQASKWKWPNLLIISPLSPYFPLDQNIPKTSFDDKNFPGQMFEIYMREISSKFACPKQCYILSFIYIDRVLERNPSFPISRINANKLILTSIFLAIKFVDDERHDISFYANAGNISSKELEELEIDMLNLLGYQVYVDDKTYFAYENMLKIHTQIIYNENNHILTKAMETIETEFTPIMTETESLPKTRNFSNEFTNEKTNGKSMEY